MCGFIGLISEYALQLEEVIFAHRALEELYHRGPDDQQAYYDEHAYLGFNRLSINDLVNGGQPFSVSQIPIHVLFNGEIYNYLTLKKELEDQGVTFKTNSEVEVILQLFISEGVNFINKLRGMFAILIYDASKQTIYLTRDCFGIKPLYYFYDHHHLFISSELKPFKLLPLDESAFDFKTMQHYFTFQYIPEPFTFIKDVKPVTPGSVMQIQLGQFPIEINEKTYQFTPIANHSFEKTKLIQKTLYESVCAHMLSDVEVGTFLSGGIDSTIVTSCAANINPNIKAYTIGFDVSGYSEIDEAKKTADYLNIEMNEIKISANDYLSRLSDVIHFLDAPVADPSVIPIYCIAKRASEDVKVILSGEGADELFGGYGIYREPNSLAIFNRIPNWSKTLLLYLSQFMPNGLKGKSFIERGCIPLSQRYVGNAFVFNELEKQQLLRVYNNELPFETLTRPIFEQCQSLDLISQMQSIDLQTWLKGDILVKSDRLSMANSLELRVPFLDKHVFEVAKTLSKDEKVAGKTTKYLLREAFKDIVPPHVYTAKKRGYPVPLTYWLQDELYDFAKENLNCEATHHIINHQYALSLLDDHAKGRQNNARKIWTLLIFNLWYKQWITK